MFLQNSIEIKIFFKSIGSKSTLRSSNVNQAVKNINAYGDALKLELLDPKFTFVDFCVAATSQSNGLIGKVSNL